MAVHLNFNADLATQEMTRDVAQVHSFRRIEVLTGCSDFFSKIWKAFTECIKSCLNCFGLCSKTRNRAYESEFTCVASPKEVSARLERQMQRGMQQMQQEVSKSFVYRDAPADWDMHEEVIDGYLVGISHAQGRRPTMEDEHLATSFNLFIGGRSYPVQLFGIFDGHGGREASKYVRDHLKTELEKALIECNADGLGDVGIFRALKLTTARISCDFKDCFPKVAHAQGTTATIAMILDQRLWTANVGDSRTVLDNHGTPFQLTEDAKPADPRYKKGIEKRGGVVQNIFGVERVNGDLAVARAIGDHRLNGAVSARSKITVKPLSEIQSNSHLILCCDGIYDVACTTDIVQAAHENRNLTPGDLARNIVYSAYQSGSTDNLSSMVIKISP